MAVASATLEQMGGAFFDALRLRADTDQEARQHLGAQLDAIAVLLPEPESWTVFGDGNQAELLLLAGDVLFRLGRERAPGGARQFLVVSRPADVIEVGYRRIDQRTSWNFEFRDRDPLAVDGRLEDNGEPDGPERFARALALRCGWSTETANP